MSRRFVRSRALFGPLSRISNNQSRFTEIATRIVPRGLDDDVEYHVENKGRGVGGRGRSSSERSLPPNLPPRERERERDRMIRQVPEKESFRKNPFPILLHLPFLLPPSIASRGTPRVGIPVFWKTFPLIERFAKPHNPSTTHHRSFHLRRGYIRFLMYIDSCNFGTNFLR